MLPFSVSVIIPVYNAERFLQKSVESALALRETGEIILIEDCSPDNSLSVCNDLLQLDERIRLLRHPHNENRGAGASRNLGILHSNCEFVAFLDADDFYLSNRFDLDREILTSQPEVDGTYNALGTIYESEDVKTRWLNFGNHETLTLNSPAPPTELPLVLLHGHSSISGSFHTNTITVRRSFLNRVGLFNEKLRLRQDIHMWFRMSVLGKLAAAEISTPVSMRRVHANNRMTNPKDHAPYADFWWNDIGKFLHKNNPRPDILFAWRRGYAYHLASSRQKLPAIYHLFRLFISDPSILRKPYNDFDTILRVAYGQSKTIDRLLSLKNRLIASK
jgi:glycosyltransferase involved in cell wall biosynthesis